MALVVALLVFSAGGVFVTLRRWHQRRQRKRIERQAHIQVIQAQTALFTTLLRISFAEQITRQRLQEVFARRHQDWWLR